MLHKTYVTTTTPPPPENRHRQHHHQHQNTSSTTGSSSSSTTTTTTTTTTSSSTAGSSSTTTPPPAAPAPPPALEAHPRSHRLARFFGDYYSEERIVRLGRHRPSSVVIRGSEAQIVSMRRSRGGSAAAAFQYVCAYHCTYHTVSLIWSVPPKKSFLRRWHILVPREKLI